MLIESTGNSLVKRTRALAHRKSRIETGLHFIEGERLVREAVISGAILEDGFIEEGHDLMTAILEGSGAKVHFVTRSVMKTLTNTIEPQWVCATVKTPINDVPDVYPDGLVVILDEVQDPGNVGTILRTADAFGAVGLLINEGCADPFAPKPIRASMGSVYHLPIWRGNIEQELIKLGRQGFDLICGHLGGEDVLPAIHSRAAVIIGNEGRGVRDEISDLCFKYRLPMYGRAESLNASVAAGILIYKIAEQINRS